jgi:hypothetical protein
LNPTQQALTALIATGREVAAKRDLGASNAWIDTTTAKLRAIELGSVAIDIERIVREAQINATKHHTRPEATAEGIVGDAIALLDAAAKKGGTP